MANKIYDGYMTKPGRKTAFEVSAVSKKDAYNQMKESYPDWRVYIVGYHTGKRIKR